MGRMGRMDGILRNRGATLASLRCACTGGCFLHSWAGATFWPVVDQDFVLAVDNLGHFVPIESIQERKCMGDFATLFGTLRFSSIAFVYEKKAIIIFMSCLAAACLLQARPT